MNFNGLTAEVSITTTTEGQSVVTLSSQNTTSTAANHDYTVPTGKYWVLKHAVFNRANAGLNSIGLDGGSAANTMQIGTSSQAYQVFELFDEKISAAQTIRLTAGAGTSGSITTNLFYEEYDA